MHDILTPSTIDEYLSIISICIEKQKAQISIKKSPLLIEKPSFIHNRYNPTSEITTLIHTFTGTFFLNRIPSIGTITMYNDVIKPDFPTVVYCIPIC